MTETKELYNAGPNGAPPPDTVLTALEAIRDVVHEELARIERDGGCAGAWLRVEALVGRVLR